MRNGVGHIVDVIEGSMEDVMLPGKVDVIISKWMSYFLVRESMFNSVICALDRFFFKANANHVSQSCKNVVSTNQVWSRIAKVARL